MFDTATRRCGRGSFSRVYNRCGLASTVTVRFVFNILLLLPLNVMRSGAAYTLQAKMFDFRVGSLIRPAEFCFSNVQIPPCFLRDGFNNDQTTVTDANLDFF